MQLSKSALDIFKNCPCCFWYDRNMKISRPRGIFSSLPNGIDGILKKTLESFRGNLPYPLLGIPELEGYFLYDGDDLGKMRNWKSNPYKMQDAKGNTIVGAFDDILYNSLSCTYAVLDYKSKGSEPTMEYCQQYCQDQVNLYTKFLNEGGKKTADFGVLLYFWPEPDDGFLIRFKSKVFLLKPNLGDADKLFREAMACLNGPCPPPSPDCEFCKYVFHRSVGK